MGSHSVTAVKYLRSGAVSIEVDGESIGEADPVELRLKKGDLLTDEQLEAARDTTRRFGALASGARSLAASGFSKKGLERRLVQKGVDRQSAKEAADYFEGRGYLNDADYARDRAEIMHRGKNYGRRRIVAELIRQGVDVQTAREAAEELPPDGEAIARAMERRRIGDLSDRRERERQWRHFTAAGFSPDVIRAALSAAQEEDSDEFDEYGD